jgi:hypothetical protein
LIEIMWSKEGRLLWTTDASGNMSNPTGAASIGLSPWVTTQGAGQIKAMHAK